MIARESLFHYAFPTSLGWIAMAWSPRGLKRLSLPDRDRARTERRVADGLESKPAEPPAMPDWVAKLGDDLKLYGEGARIDFSDVAVDLRGIDPLRIAIYAALRGLRHGETVTYGELATRVGKPRAAREIGTAMGRNPVPIVIPCHRVTAAAGRLGGFSAPGGAETKRRLLVLERAAPSGGPQLMLALE